MVQSSKSGRTFRVGAGSDLVCQNISGLHTKFFVILRVTTFFFRGVDLLYSPR